MSVMDTVHHYSLAHLVWLPPPRFCQRRLLQCPAGSWTNGIMSALWALKVRECVSAEKVQHTSYGRHKRKQLKDTATSCSCKQLWEWDELTLCTRRKVFGGRQTSITDLHLLTQSDAPEIQRRQFMKSLWLSLLLALQPHRQKEVV